MRIGPEKDYEPRLHLHDWAASTGWGIIGYSMHTDLPQDCIEYVLSSFDFWQTPLPRSLEDVARWGAWATYWQLDIGDPYHIFMGVSDVNWSEDWRKFAFDVVDPVSGQTVEAEPDLLETYIVAPPGQCEQTYQQILKYGGEFFEEQKRAGRPLSGKDGLLATLPHSIGWMIEEHIDGEAGWESCLDLLSEDSLRFKKFEAFCNNDPAIAYDYFYKAAWAAYLWMVGPPGREWRNGMHDIFFMCSKSQRGTALLYDYNLIDEQHYTRLARAAESCAACGLDSWCVDLTQIDGTNRHLCEHCLNGSQPLYAKATCGTKVCKHVNCQYNPMFGKQDGLLTHLRQSGQLVGRVNNNQMLDAKAEPKLLTN